MKKYKSNIDGNGRVVIPKIYRESIGVKNNSPVEVILEDDKIVIKKSTHINVCALCQSDKDLVNINKAYICAKCIKNIKEYN